jgi:hypothetical protein
MSTINGKLGLKAAGKRSMMKLPTDRELRNRITSAVCPACQRTGARPSKTQPGGLYCTWCNHVWELPVE